MTRPRLHRACLVCALVVAALVLTGVAHAAWNAGGGGSGSAGTGTALAVTVSPATASAQLYPGGQADVALMISNPNPFGVRIGTLALATGQGTGGFAVDAGHATCPTSVLSLPTQTNGGSGWTVPAKVGGAVNGSLAVTLTGAVSMSTAAANACQGATFTVYVAAGV